MIIYFSGTGNSKYIADLAAAQLGDTAVDAAALIKTGENPDLYSEKPFVFVAPVYSWRLPRVFEKWLTECSLEGNKNAYFVITCGSEIGAAGKYAKKLAEEMQLSYKGTAAVVMPENYLVMFDPPAKHEDGDIVSKAAEHTKKLCEKISAGLDIDELKVTFIGRLCSGIVNSSFYTFYIGTRKFYATDNCISCGKCVQGCMLNNISLRDGKPVWGRECTHCMACICKCPTEAIEYGKNTKGKRRYVFSENNE